MKVKHPRGESSDQTIELEGEEGKGDEELGIVVTERPTNGLEGERVHHREVTVDEEAVVERYKTKAHGDAVGDHDCTDDEENSRKQSLSWKLEDGERRNDVHGEILYCFAEPATDFVPIHYIPERGDVIGSLVLILEVVRVLPHVERENRRTGVTRYT